MQHWHKTSLQFQYQISKFIVQSKEEQEWLPTNPCDKQFRSDILPGKKGTIIKRKAYKSTILYRKGETLCHFQDLKMIYLRSCLFEVCLFLTYTGQAAFPTCVLSLIFYRGFPKQISGRCVKSVYSKNKKRCLSLNIFNLCLVESCVGSQTIAAYFIEDRT